MDRRSFLFVFSLGGLSAPLAADAQPTGKVYRIGYLGMGSATVSPPFVEAFREGLRELGLVEGQNIVIDYRFAEGRFDRLPELAAELVLLRVDVIMAGPTPQPWRPRTLPGRSLSSWRALAIPLSKDSSRASRARVGTSQGCPSALAWTFSAKTWSCSGKPFPRPDAWRSSRTRPIRATRSL